jgi:type II secretory pathway component GspD/PulD (secretin)
MGNSGRLAFLLLAFLTTGSPWAAEQALSTIELRHRPAEELAPLIQPLLGPADVVIPNRNQLILKASPETIAEIRALLDQIDKSPHRLLIMVAQGSHLSGESLNAGARIQGRIDLNRPDHSGVDIRGHAYQSGGRNDTHATQQVQTLDGQSAVIQVGSQIPVPHGYGGIEYRAVTTGFAVTPRLAGSQVLIDVEPWSDRLGSGRSGVINTQSAHTQLKANLGEWVEVGGLMETSVQEQSGLANQGYSARDLDSRIFLKVEDLDAGKP